MGRFKVIPFIGSKTAESTPFTTSRDSGDRLSAVSACWNIAAAGRRRTPISIQSAFLESEVNHWVLHLESLPNRRKHHRRA